MPGVGGEALSYGAGMCSALPSLSSASAFVSQPPARAAEEERATGRFEDPALSRWCSSEAVELCTSLQHSREIKLLHGQTDLLRAGSSCPCPQKEDTVPSLPPLLVLRLARLQAAFHAQQDQS